MYTTIHCNNVLCPQDKEALVHDKDGLKSLLDELGRELRQTKADLGEEQKGTDDLRAQLEVLIPLIYWSSVS